MNKYIFDRLYFSKLNYRIAVLLGFLMFSFQFAQAQMKSEGLSKLEGTWVGQGYQLDNNSTWSIKLTIKGDNYQIEYPSLDCKGVLKFEKQSSDGIMLTEKITSGSCVTNGHVALKLSGKNEMYFKWSFSNGEPGSFSKLVRF
jgi:hypothetical protein